MKSIIQDMKHNYLINAIIMVLLGLVLVIWPHILRVFFCASPKNKTGLGCEPNPDCADNFYYLIPLSISKPVTPSAISRRAATVALSLHSIFGV